MGRKLTERYIEQLACPEGRKDQLVFDAEQRGLAVRVVAAGSKSYLAQYSLAGRKHRVPLGSVDAISLAMARQAAQVIMGEVAKGANPAVDRKVEAETAKVLAKRERVTLSRLVGDWERLHLALRRDRYRADSTQTLRRVFAEWCARPAERLARSDVVATLDKLSPSVSRATLAYGRACFGWAVRRGVLSTNPFADVPAPAANIRRDRVLDDKELASVWRAAELLGPPYGPAVGMLLLTGQRRDEVCGMRWEEVASDLRTWTVSGERTKNGLPSVVPLSMPARALLGRPPKVRRGLVFPGRDRRPFGNWSKQKAKLDKAAGVSGWRLHDLRRTVATGLQRLGVRFEVTESVLNHSSGSRGGISGIYQRHDWADEKRAALEAWAAHVLGLVGAAQPDAKVLRIAGRRA